MDLEQCKGMRDWLPPDIYRFRHIEAIFRSLCLQWGYEEVRTPTLEYLHLFTAAGTLTPAMLSRVYSFLDWDGWSGERVVLRPEGTIPTVRLYLSQSQKERGRLARLFYVQNVFSFEETGQSHRERWQCGVEHLGSAEPVADAELILLGSEALRRLGFREVAIKLSHQGLIHALLKELGLRTTERLEILDQVLEKGAEALQELSGLHPDLKQALLLLQELKGDSASPLRNIQALLIPTLPGLGPSLANFIQVAEALTALGCKYEIDVALGRGFEYYTGVVFQFYLGEERVGSGGRYDELIPLLGGETVPASGFALAMEPLIAQLELDQGAQPGVILVQSEGAWNRAFSVAQELRQAGFRVALQMGEADTKGDWVLRLPQGQDSLFVLSDGVGKREQRLGSLRQVIKALEERGAGKIGPA